MTRTPTLPRPGSTTSSSPTPPASPGAPGRTGRGATMAGVIIGQLMIVLDMTVIAVALPHMQQDLDMTTSQSPWTVTGYSLAFGGLVLFGGRLCAVMGIRRSYPVGLVGFALASLAAGMAPNFAVLVATRVVQGCFAALLSPTMLSLINVTFTGRGERERAFAAFGATGGLGAAAGLLIGGALTEWLDWRWSLYVNLLFAAAALVVGMRGLPPTDRRDRTSRLTDDLTGLVLGCGACFSAVFGLDRAQQTSWGSMQTVSWLALAALALVLFVVRERRAASPVLPLSMLALPVRSASYATQFLMGAAQMGAIVYLTYYLQDHFGYSPMKTGVAFLPMIVALVATAVPAGRFLVPRAGTRGTLPLGLAAMCASMLVLTRVTPEAGYADVTLPGLVVFGVGVGLTMPVTFNSGTRGVPENRTGVAAAILSAAQQIGGSFGVALMASYATQHAEDYAAEHTDEVRTAAAQAMAQAQVLPDSAAGQEIVRTLTASLADSAKIDAYSGGFALMGWILAVATAVLVACAVALGARRRRWAGSGEPGPTTGRAR